MQPGTHTHPEVVHVGVGEELVEVGEEAGEQAEGEEEHLDLEQKICTSGLSLQEVCINEYACANKHANVHVHVNNILPSL